MILEDYGIILSLILGSYSIYKHFKKESLGLLSEVEKEQFDHKLKQYIPNPDVRLLLIREHYLDGYVTAEVGYKDMKRIFAVNIPPGLPEDQVNNYILSRPECKF